MRIYLATIIFLILSFCLYSQDSSSISNNNQYNSDITSNTNDIAIEINNITNVNVATEVKPKTINTNSGLFLDFNLVGNYHPINAGATVGIFYRFEPIKSSNKLFKGNRLDLGFENIFLLNANIVGVYANFIPTIFMELDIRGYYNTTFNMLDYGYIGLDNFDDELYFSSISSTKGENASGYSFSIAPKFKWLFASNVEIANETTVTFLSLGNENFYLNRNTYEIYKKSDIEIVNEFSLLTHTSLVKVGPSYSILYILGTKTFTQSLDLNLHFEKYYLENKNLRLYFDLKSGFYLSSTYYLNSVFINMKLGIQYQIL